MTDKRTKVSAIPRYLYLLSVCLSWCRPGRVKQTSPKHTSSRSRLARVANPGEDQAGERRVLINKAAVLSTVSTWAEV